MRGVAQENGPDAPGFGRRLGGWVVDLALQLTLTSLVVWLTYAGVLDSVRSTTGLLTTTWRDLLSFDGDARRTATTALISVGEDVQLTAAMGLVAVVLICIAYFAFCASLFGRTVGMMASGTRIVDAGTGGRPSASKTIVWATVRAVTDIGLYTVAWLLPLFGLFLAGVVAWAVSVLVVVGNGLAAFGGSHRTIVDQVSGIRIVRDRLVADLAGRTGTAVTGAVAGAAQAIPAERLEHARTVGNQWAGTAADASRQAADVSRRAASHGADVSKRAASQGLDVSRRAASQGLERGHELGANLRGWADRHRR